jgi:hypothetical protein
MRQVGRKGIGRRGNLFAAPRPSPTGAGLPWLASQGRQFGPQGPRQKAPRWKHRRARSEASGAHSSRTLETWRTPVSAAGCNKPAGRRAEKTVEAGRNGKGGTSSDRGRSEPKVGASSPKSDREWTRADCVDGGAILGQPQERRPDEVGFERVNATCKVAFTPSPMKATNGL